MSKCIEEIKLHLSSELKRDIQDLAMLDDRSVSEWIRLELERMVYGRVHVLRVARSDEKDEGR